MKLQVENLSFAYDDQPILEDIFLHVNQGEFVGLIGLTAAANQPF